jgi:hypothetical protein
VKTNKADQRTKAFIAPIAAIWKAYRRLHPKWQGIIAVLLFLFIVVSTNKDTQRPPSDNTNTVVQQPENNTVVQQPIEPEKVRSPIIEANRGKFFLATYNNAKEQGIPIDYLEETINADDLIRQWGDGACEAMIDKGMDDSEVVGGMTVYIDQQLPYTDSRLKGDIKRLAATTIHTADETLCPMIPAK